MHLSTSVRFGETPTHNSAKQRKETRQSADAKLTVPIGESCILVRGKPSGAPKGQMPQDGTPSFILQVVSRTGTLVRPSRGGGYMKNEPAAPTQPLEPTFDRTPQPFGSGPPDPIVCDASPRSLRQRTVNFAAKRMVDMR